MIEKREKNREMRCLAEVDCSLSLSLSRCVSLFFSANDGEQMLFLIHLLVLPPTRFCQLRARILPFRARSVSTRPGIGKERQQLLARTGHTRRETKTFFVKKKRRSLVSLASRSHSKTLGGNWRRPFRGQGADRSGLSTCLRLFCAALHSRGLVRDAEAGRRGAREGRERFVSFSSCQAKRESRSVVCLLLLNFFELPQRSRARNGASLFEPRSYRTCSPRP